MQRYPGLHQLVLLSRQFTFQQFSVRNLEDGLRLCIFNVNVRKVMLPSIKHIHSDENSVEHADGWHGASLTVIDIKAYHRTNVVCPLLLTTPTTAAHKLVLVDASGLNSVNEKGEAVTGLTYKSVNTAAETVKLGGGIDSVTLGASTYGKMDTVEGLKLVVSGGALTAASDTITITGNAGLAAAGKMTTTQTDLDLALLDAAKFKAAGVDVDTVAFQLGGNTYFYQDTNGDELVDVADTVVKFTGLIDLDALVIAL